MSTQTNKRILVIDDNRAIHDDFRKIFCPDGGTIDAAEAEFFSEAPVSNAHPVFDIDSAYQGEEGIAALKLAVEQGRPYAMAFVDVRMPPGIDGIETIARLWQISSELQVVVCTAHSDYSWQEMVARLGNRDRLLVLKKPFAAIEALQLASALTEKWELTRQAKERLTETERIVAERTAELQDTNGKLRAEIQHRELVEAQLLRAQRLESIGTLASGIAHDLNNMLGPILMGAQLLHDGSLDPKDEPIIATIEENAQRAADVVKQVLTFARGMEGERAPLDVSHLIRDMRKIMGETFPKTITLRVECNKGLAPVNGDATQLHQVLLNLCVNARDAMPDGGALTIEASNFEVDQNYASMTPEAHTGRYVLVRVSDTGCGIPREVLDKIFDPFFTTKPIGKGTGLGLSTVAGIVRGHGGFINVSSHLGKGTVFEIFLPASTDCASLDPSPAPKSAPRGHGELVLIVDDESTVREVTATILRENGYQTLLAADGSEALSIYAERTGEINAVLTDLIMPFVDGVALCRALRKMDPVVKLIASTGEETRRAELNSLHVQGFLSKPFGTETLLVTLREALGDGRTPAVPRINPSILS